MKFHELKIKGVFIVEIEKIEDERGFFARTWDKNEFLKNNLNPEIVQCNISFNSKKGTIRGMHYQESPYEEAKIVKCVKGKVFEVFIDLRKNSETFKKWGSVELSSEENFELYVPEGFALGFQTLEDNTELFYQMSQYYMPENANGIRWDDPMFNIKWPMTPSIISQKDKDWTNFKD
ncbi:dTDP-4-dehydrorhamnose 3,5-epimerase [Candidatus Nitrosopumilus koreensis AR1]|uniref:dTDP-4-dehydrorhamnose 3,5-epimerase n=1 Tax=Candidatus Nitrosopumilus koreensis AR1 TaxID=1229908 RepID=K0B1X7_9ARCH|nr:MULTISPECIES: dTDP-4-dehydrorhamnose 3,5-epimerase [Nitrosopumilus]AFS80013.1 dTDP-4-dehydrorhamnose 3,5-epimerase [Candidatus Nitrosopumilus koreensis AR1]